MANPQSWNRYSYVENRPILFNDPSGHDSVCGNSNSDPECEQDDAPINPIDPGGPLEPGLPQGNSNDDDDPDEDLKQGHSGKKGNDDLRELVDWLLWMNVPSAFGFHIGISGQLGPGFIEPQITPVEFLLLVNWRSREIDLFYSVEGSAYHGTPTLYGGNIYFGATTIKGLSQNQNFEGYSFLSGTTAGADVFGKVGVSRVNGMPVDSDNPLTRYVDPGSGFAVTYTQHSITVGGNLAANGLDVGVYNGYGYTGLITRRSK